MEQKTHNTYDNDLSYEERENLRNAAKELKETSSKIRSTYLFEGEYFYHHRGIFLAIESLMHELAKSSHAKRQDPYKVDLGYVSEKLESITKDFEAIREGEL